MSASPVQRCRPLTADNFCDLEMLFSAPGCSFARNCWCMDYRVSGKIRTPDGREPPDQRAHRKQRLEALAAATPTPGLIGYDAQDRAIGWVAVGPRAAFPRLQNSPIMKPVRETDSWAVVCFVVPTAMRGRGVAAALLHHAVSHAQTSGAPALEAFPIDRQERSQAQWLWHGAMSMFTRAGFEEVARRKPGRPVVRLQLPVGERDERWSRS